MKIKKIFVFILFVVFIMGCYHKQNVYDQSTTSNQDENVNNVSPKNIQKFLSTIKKVDGDLEAKYKMVLHFQKRKKHKIAVEILHEVIQKQPLFTKAYNAMGVSYDHLGEHNRAIKAYRYALKLDPSLDYAHNNLGYSYLLNGKFDLAIEAFQKAISLNENNKLYHNNLGLAYAENGQFDLALAQFSFDGDEIAANRKLGKLLNRKGKFELSKKYFAKADQLKVSSASIAPVVTLPAKESIGLPSDSPKKDEKVTKSESMDVISDYDQQPAQTEKLLISEYTTQHSEKQKIIASDAPSFTKESIGLPLDSPTKDDMVTKFESIDTISDNDQQSLKAEKILISNNYSSNSDNENTISRAELETGTINSQKYITEISKDSNQDGKKNAHIVKAESSDINEHSKKISSIVIEDKTDKDFLVDTEIEVSNGNGVNNMAKRVGNYFEKKGLIVSRLTNAEHFNFKETKIFYLRPYLHDAYIVAQHIPGWQNMEEVDELSRQNVKIKVLIGKDLIPYHSLRDN
jgi:Flp pilus assembly protein TadD